MSHLIRCLAIDDEAYAANIIAAFIQKTPFLTLVGTVTNALDALQLVQEGKVDLIFLDIQMPELTGIQFLKIIGNKCKVILTTAYPDYALEGYELDVVDYLMKPIGFERFLRAAQKAKEIITPLANVAQDEPKTTEVTAPENNYLFVKGDRKNTFSRVQYNEILYVEGLKNYVIIHTSSNKIITYQNLKDLEIKLPTPPFFRIHKSYIISLEQAQNIEGNSVIINKQIIPIGEHYRTAFFEHIKLL
ncbi:LytR/AlgR family response regulator transcription factor [Flavobacterium sp. '19STA2R22 D10 B1']|uniref:LytR/AlgR family response regulator transcription factor n=1 Tax=Flavobacterium aerium TaxID=3037261 RepID=UPI00278C5971|nr:LytTR family DNA-binding domain-containing protein [Flavobacterium sp. '19STA2R22 D10 B1']